MNSQHDHRIAMSFLVLGMVGQQAITVVDTETITLVFQATGLMNGAGAHMLRQRQGETSARDYTTIVQGFS